MDIKKNINKNKLQKGWMMLLVCMLIQAIPFCIAANAQPIFMGPVMEKFGFSLTGFSLMFTIGTIMSSVSGPIVGKLFSKINLKIMYIVGALLSGGMFMAFSMANQLWQFYILYGIVQIGNAIISAIGVPILINAWFDEDIRGKALGIAFAGGSIGNMFIQPALLRVIESNGPSKAYLIFGAISLIVALFIGIFLVKMPKDASEIVTSKKDKNKVEENVETVDISYSLKEAQGTKFFWMLSVGFLFVGLYVSAYSIQWTNYFRSVLQLETSVIALTASIFAMASLFGNVLGGILFDKLGVVKTLTLSFVAVLVSGTFITMAGTNPLFAHLHSLVKGLAVFVYMMTPAYVVGQYFGSKDYGTILGMLQLLFAVGFSAGSVLFGVLVGAFGYDVTWMIVLAYVVAAFILLISASKGMEKLNKERRARMESEMVA